MAASSRVLVDHLEDRREQVSGVSLDEETIDLIRYQRAYQAAARLVSVINEMLDDLIALGRG
jgi:flagellar hook-associated protein 1 FlgK